VCSDYTTYEGDWWIIVVCQKCFYDCWQHVLAVNRQRSALRPSSEDCLACRPVRSTRRPLPTPRTSQRWVQVLSKSTIVTMVVVGRPPVERNARLMIILNWKILRITSLSFTLILSTKIGTNTDHSHNPSDPNLEPIFRTVPACFRLLRILQSYCLVHSSALHFPMFSFVCHHHSLSYDVKKRDWWTYSADLHVLFAGWRHRR